MTIKKCVICGKEFDAYRNMKTCSDKCKEERIKKRMREYKKQWYLKNKEKIKEQQKRYREHNKKYVKKCWRKNSQKWREQHKEQTEVVYRLRSVLIG